MIELVPVKYYGPVFYWTMFAICFLTSSYYLDSKGCDKLLKQRSTLLPFLFTALLTIFIGLRPSSYIFGDMGMYRHLWNMTNVSSIDFFFDFEREWFFELVLKTCKLLVRDVQFWFFIVCLFFIGCQFWACKKLLWENVWMAIMFLFFSYQLYPYATNGIRNGMGTALMMLSISFFCHRNWRGYIIGLLLFILAIGCHRSLIVPMAALMVSLFIIKDIKYAVYIWVGCIFVSITAGGYFQGLFEGLSYDNRMTNYSNASEEIMAQFSRLGFRWDFLLYSAMPVLLASYVRYRGIFDQTFTLLANTYIIANSFWVLVCRAAYSNRFAYLSWFIYALVIAYAVIRVPIWKDQDRIAGWILLAHSFFTIIMYLIAR